MNRIDKKEIIKEVNEKENNFFNVGKNEVSANLIKAIEEYIAKHEAVKIKVLKSAKDNKDIIIKELTKKLKAEVISDIGSTFILYRKKKDKMV